MSIYNVKKKKKKKKKNNREIIMFGQIFCGLCEGSEEKPEGPDDEDSPKTLLSSIHLNHSKILIGIC